MMSGILGGKKAPKPKLPAPTPIPEAPTDAGDEAALRARRRSGFAKTILTGSLEPARTGKKTTLG